MPKQKYYYAVVDDKGELRENTMTGDPALFTHESSAKDYIRYSSELQVVPIPADSLHKLILSHTNKKAHKKYPIGGYAPGNYYGKCCDCGNEFQGDKRAFQCEPCAVKQEAAFNALTPEEQVELIKRNAEAAKKFFDDLHKPHHQ